MSEVVPEGWENKTIGDLIKFTGGAQPPRDTFVFQPRNGYVRLLQIRDYKTDKYATYIPIELSRRKCDEKDVMIGRYGPPIFQILRGKRGSYNVALIKAESKVFNLIREYMYYFLTRSDLFTFIESLSQRTSGQTGIDIEALKSFNFPLPPLPEQKKIASILTSVDEVIENKQKQIDKLQDLKKATMNQLLTKGIGHTEFKDSELGRIPKSWEVKTCDDLIKFSGGAQPPRSSFIFTPRQGYVRLLQIRDYKSDKFATYIPEKLSRRNCTEEDVLIGRYGPPIFQILRGKSGSYNVALIKAEPRNDTLLKGYMYHFLTRSDLFQMIDSLSQRTSGQTGIDLDALKSFGFPFPPPEEQHRILGILDHMDASVKRLHNKLAQTQSLKKSLMQDLLTGKKRVQVN